MKAAKKLFAFLFVIAYAICANQMILRAPVNAYRLAAEAYPSKESMSYQVNEAGHQMLPFLTPLLEGHALIQLALQKTESGGMDVIAVNDGGYVRGHEDAWLHYDVEQFAIGLYQLKEDLKEAGSKAEVVYISTQPQIINGYTEPLADFPLPDQDALMETLMYSLNGYRVDYLDAQFSLGRSSLQPSEYIYKTGSIWTTQASFAVAQSLVDHLNDRYDANIDPNGEALNPENFKHILYEDAFIGTMGMRTGEPFTGLEDFTAILPAYSTNYEYVAKGVEGVEDLRVTGTFEKTLFSQKHLQSEDHYQYNVQSVYMDGGAYYERVLVNRDRPDAPKVLFIHDSTALPFAAFLSLGLSETHMYWPAQAPAGSSFDLVDYVEAHDIDYVFFIAQSNFYSLRDIFSY